MIVIYACIYNNTNLGSFETKKLNEGLASLKIEQFINVFSVPMLIEALDENKDKKILLFCNFPPKESYIRNNAAQSIFDEFENIVPDWNVAEYSVSAGLFMHICKKYKLMAIHFITGAPISHVKDSMIQSLTGNILTTVKRKHDWAGSGINHESSLRTYVMRRIRESLENNL